MTIVSDYKFTLNGRDQYINVPVEIKWDFNGREDSLDEYQKDIVTQLIGTANDFEVFRFEHDSYGTNQKTQLNYVFNFYSGDNKTITESTVTSSDWKTTYIGTEFTQDQVYRRLKPFTKSFYKLDFYVKKFGGVIPMTNMVKVEPRLDLQSICVGTKL